MIFVLKTTGVVLAKTVANNAVPGLGAAVDFVQAGYDLRQGDIAGAAINTVTGVADLYSFGLFSSVKEAMKEGAKESTKEGAKVMGKKAVKEATKKVGHKVARQIAQGTFKGGKEAASKYASAMALEVRKEVMKEFRERLGKDLSRGLISESVEKVFEEGTKKAAGGVLGDLFCKVVSTGGNDVAKRIFEGYFEDGIQLAISQALKQNPKLAFEFAKIAEEGALKEFKKNISKIIAKNVGVACAKGAINFSAKVNIPTEYEELRLRLLVEVPSIRI